MQISFSLYDILGYILPGILVMLIILILIHPDILGHPLNDPENGLAYYLPITAIQGILYGFAAYFIGFLLRGCSDAFFKFVPRGKWLKKLNMHNRSSWFMKRLFEPDYRDSSGDFNLYSDQFVSEFKNQIEEIFAISVDDIERDVEYIEIFDFCRYTLMNQSPTVYSRALVLFSRYESAKLMMFVFSLATFGFLTRGIHLWIMSEPDKWLIIILAAVSFLLVFPFFHMYEKLLGYYRKTMLYGFYEYAVTREKPRDSGNTIGEVA
jgi:hypothetical protein